MTSYLICWKPASVDNALVSRNKLLVHALHTAAEKLLPRVYAPKVGIGGAEDLPPVQSLDLTDSKTQVEVAKRIAFTFAAAKRVEEAAAKAEFERLLHQRPEAAV